MVGGGVHKSDCIGNLGIPALGGCAEDELRTGGSVLPGRVRWDSVFSALGIAHRRRVVKQPHALSCGVAYGADSVSITRSRAQSLCTSWQTSTQSRRAWTSR